MATGRREISADNKTITVQIKKGVKYAPPVNREVKAADIKYAFERAFTKNVPNGYAGTYFSSIVGTPSKPNTGDPRTSRASRRPTTTRSSSSSRRRGADASTQALVMPITMPVPKEYAAKFDKSTPSTYDQYVVFTGPYMVKNDSDRQAHRLVAGQADPARPQPELGQVTDFRPAYLDSITDRRRATTT